MNLEDRFDLSDTIVCIKDYKTLVIGRSYRIGGCGDLSMLFPYSGHGKGYGFSIKDDYSKEYPEYYFTIAETDEHFIPYDEYYKSYIRENKINTILK